MVDRIIGERGFRDAIVSQKRKDSASAGANPKTTVQGCTLLELESRLRSALAAMVLDQDVERVLVLELIDSLGCDFVGASIKDQLIERLLQKIKNHGDLELKMRILVGELQSKKF